MSKITIFNTKIKNLVKGALIENKLTYYKLYREPRKIKKTLIDGHSIKFYAILPKDRDRVTKNELLEIVMKINNVILKDYWNITCHVEFINDVASIHVIKH